MLNLTAAVQQCAGCWWSELLKETEPPKFPSTVYNQPCNINAFCPMSHPQDKGQTHARDRKTRTIPELPVSKFASVLTDMAPTMPSAPCSTLRTDTCMPERKKTRTAQVHIRGDVAPSMPSAPCSTLRTTSARRMPAMRVRALSQGVTTTS